MIHEVKVATMEGLRNEVRFLRRALLASLGAFALVGGAIFVLWPTPRTVLVPPTIHQSFWVEGDRASGEALEEMAYFVVPLFLDLTPDNVDYNLRLLQRYASPALHGSLQKEMLAAGERLRRENAATQASIREIRADPKRQRVALIGTLTTRVAGRDVSTDKKAWAIQFRFSGGRIQLDGIKETTNNDPFGDAAVAPRP